MATYIARPNRTTAVRLVRRYNESERRDGDGNPALYCWRYLRFLVPGLLISVCLTGWAATTTAVIPGCLIGIPSTIAVILCGAGIVVSLNNADKFPNPRVILDHARWKRCRQRPNIIPVPKQVFHAFKAQARRRGLPLDGTSWTTYPRATQAVLGDGFDLICEVLDLMEPLASGQPLDADLRRQIEARLADVGQRIADTEYEATEPARQIQADDQRAYNEGVRQSLKTRPPLPPSP